MVIFKSCQCGKPLISLEKGTIFARNTINITKNECSINCPNCQATTNFKKDEFNDFFISNTTTVGSFQ